VVVSASELQLLAARLEHLRGVGLLNKEEADKLDDTLADFVSMQYWEVAIRLAMYW